MYVVGVDPGKTCGFAVYAGGRFEGAGEKTYLSFLTTMESFFREHAAKAPDDPLHVVVENYTIGRSTLSKGVDAHWAIGARAILSYWCETIGGTFHDSSTASKRFASDAKLRQLGWHRSTPGGHANDATRHLLVYLVHAGLITPPVTPS